MLYKGSNPRAWPNKETAIFRAINPEKRIYSVSDGKTFETIIQGLLNSPHHGYQQEGKIAQRVLQSQHARLTNLGELFYRTRDCSGKPIIGHTNRTTANQIGDKDIGGITKRTKRSFFIESATGKAMGKATQIPKYLDPNHPDFFNYAGDQVILFAPDISLKSRQGYAKNFDNKLIIVSSIEELEEAIRLLDSSGNLSPKQINQQLGQPVYNK